MTKKNSEITHFYDIGRGHSYRQDSIRSGYLSDAEFRSGNGAEYRTSSSYTQMSRSVDGVHQQVYTVQLSSLSSLSSIDGFSSSDILAAIFTLSDLESWRSGLTMRLMFLCCSYLGFSGVCCSYLGFSGVCCVYLG
jgi:hypothetical protein